MTNYEDMSKGELISLLRKRDVVLLSDYKALQAELEKWKHGSKIRDEQNRDLYSIVFELKAEREKLRKLAAECADYLDTNDMTSISHGSILHRKLLDAAMQGDKP